MRHDSRMPWNDDPSIRALRLSYNAALSAHTDRSRALSEATLRGELPSASLVQAEAVARTRLNDARAKLHAAMARAMGCCPEPPVPPSHK